MDLEIIVLSEVNQREKDKYLMIAFICGIEKIIQMNLFTKQKTQNFENKVMITKEERLQEVINYKVRKKQKQKQKTRLGLTYMLIIHKTDNQCRSNTIPCIM